MRRTPSSSSEGGKRPSVSVVLPLDSILCAALPPDKLWDQTIILRHAREGCRSGKETESFVAPSGQFSLDWKRPSRYGRISSITSLEKRGYVLLSYIHEPIIQPAARVYDPDRRLDPYDCPALLVGRHHWLCASEQLLPAILVRLLHAPRGSQPRYQTRSRPIVGSFPRLHPSLCRSLLTPLFSAQSLPECSSPIEEDSTLFSIVSDTSRSALMPPILQRNCGPGESEREQLGRGKSRTDRPVYGFSAINWSTPGESRASLCRD